jgi:hypothetical protein
VCGSYDGKVFKTSEFDAGVTAPPIHPRCRCTTVPHFDDLDGERIARDEEGKNYYVPSDTKYEEWKKTFVDGGDKSGLQPLQNNVKLTHNDEKAILDYMSAKSYPLNAKLRKGLELTGEEVAWVRRLDRALEKMPKYEGVVYRSLSEVDVGNIEDFIKQYEVGTTQLFPSYLSSGTTVYDETFPLQYIINSKTASDIRSFNPAENEILFRRNTEFIVTKIEGNTIHMDEV